MEVLVLLNNLCLLLTTQFQGTEATSPPVGAHENVDSAKIVRYSWSMMPTRTRARCEHGSIAKVRRG